MKGILFTELIELIEISMGLEFTNKVIEDARLENEGAFTSIGTYSHYDMIKLLDSLSRHIKNPKEKVLISYGEYFFYRSSLLYPKQMSSCKDTFSLLLQLQEFLEVEVRKLNPDGAVPVVEANLTAPDCLHLLYSSHQKMSLLLEGAILGCINHFQEPITLSRENLDPDDSNVRFILKKKIA